MLVGHGSRDPRSGATLELLAQRVAAAAPGLDVRLGFLEHATPSFEDVADGLTGSAVVVPLLLGAAYHATADLPVRAEAHRADLVVAAPLGPDLLLDDAVRRRGTELVLDGTDGVVVVGIGSSWARADAEVSRQARLLRSATGCPAAAAFASRPGSVVAALAALAREGATRVGLVPWMLADGQLLDRALREAGDRVVARAPALADGADLVPLILRRATESAPRHPDSSPPFSVNVACIP